MDVFCIALVFSRNQYRYRTYAIEYVETLLRLQKQIAIFSPAWIELRNELHIRFKDQANRIHCFPVEETQKNFEKEGKLHFLFRMLKLSRRLKGAEKAMQTKIDMVFLAPVDDYIRPKLGRNLFDKAFPFYWTGILTQTKAYDGFNLKLNVDPRFGDPDYLFGSQNCVAVATLDRFSPEAIRSRVYKKVVVMPDISNLSVSVELPKSSEQIKKMAKERMVVGTILMEGEDPENFMKVALEAAPDQYFFVCAGKLEPDELSETARASLLQLLGSNRNNCYFILQDTDESEQVNELLKTFDVCYLNDGNFGLPHPLLTKAAHFHKPVLGSKNDMIGQLLQAFKTGITVNGKVSESLNALATLRLQMPFEKNFDLNRFKNYAQLQSQDALRDAWESLILF